MTMQVHLAFCRLLKKCNLLCVMLTKIQVVSRPAVDSTGSVCNYFQQLSRKCSIFHYWRRNTFLISILGWQLKSNEEHKKKEELFEEDSDSSTKKIHVEDHDLSHGFLMKQACGLTVDSATRLLTQTLLALVDAHTLYRQALSELHHLYEESIRYLSNNLELEELGTEIVAVRSEMEQWKQQMLELESYMSSVEKLMMSAAEASFLCGAETVSIAASQRMYLAKRQIEEEKLKTTEEEQSFWELQDRHIQATGQFEERKRKKEEDENS